MKIAQLLLLVSLCSCAAGQQAYYSPSEESVARRDAALRPESAFPIDNEFNEIVQSGEFHKIYCAKKSNKECEEAALEYLHSRMGEEYPLATREQVEANCRNPDMEKLCEIPRALEGVYRHHNNFEANIRLRKELLGQEAAYQQYVQSRPISQPIYYGAPTKVAPQPKPREYNTNCSSDGYNVNCRTQEGP